MRGGARGRTVDEDAASEGDDEENHNEGGVALAGVALRPGVMRNLLAAEEVAGHLGHVNRREAVPYRSLRREECRDQGLHVVKKRNILRFSAALSNTECEPEIQSEQQLQW